MILNTNTLDISKVTEMPSALDLILESDEYAEWVQDNAIDYGFIVCNGDTLIEAAEDFYLFEEFRDHWIQKYETV